jgi:hypothetical protein
VLRDLSLEALCVNHRVVRPHAAIYRIVFFRRPRVYRDDKRVFNVWSIRFSDFHIDGAEGLKDNSKNFLDVNIPPPERNAEFWTETRSIRNHRM